LGKSFLIIALILSFLFLNSNARENPFLPSKVNKEIRKPTNKQNPHIPFISQNINLPSSARVLKEITIKYQNLDGSVSAKTVTVEKGIDWHKPLVIRQEREELSSLSTAKQKKNVTKSKTIKINRFLTVILKNRKIFLKTKDRKIRHFMMTKPNKIIIDFKNPSDIVSKSVNTKVPFIKNITVGNHKGYYRVVFLLDGYYKYKLHKTSNGYSIILN